MTDAKALSPTLKQYRCRRCCRSWRQEGEAAVCKFCGCEIVVVPKGRW